MTAMADCLDALSVELTARGVRHELIDSQRGHGSSIPPYIAVSDLAGRARHIHVHLSFYWYYWGSEVEDRWSVFRPDIAAGIIAERALQTGWPTEPQDGLAMEADPE